MSRVYNFSAGPSMLPEEVLTTCAKEMLEYGSSGQSVMEMSHRSSDYQKIIDAAEKDLRDVMGIPDNYTVLFLQGGASTQFAMVPMNLMTKNGKADYIITGQWAKKAYKEAARYGKARAIASSSLSDGIIDCQIACFALNDGRSNSTLYKNRRSKAESIFCVRLVVAIKIPSKFSISCKMMFCNAFSILSTACATLSDRLLIIASASLKRRMGAISDDATALR